VRLKAEETRKKAFVVELEALHRAATVASLDSKRLERELVVGPLEPLLPGKLVPTVVVTPGGVTVPREEFLAFTVAGEAVA
jgi:hypothetical protein